MLKGRVAIVDPSPPGPTGTLVSEFGKAGYQSVYVQSTPVRPRMYESLVPTGYADEIVHDGDLARTIERLSRHEPVAVVPDSEFGVPFADLLSERMGLPTNGTRLSPARRDKYRMIETVKAAGLRGARQLLVTDVGELAAWHREMGGRIVVKPLSSAGSEGVHYCDTPEQSVRAYRSLIGTENIFSMRNDSVVAQEYLAGTEYAVNTVSRDGRHHLCDIWTATQTTANGVLDLCDGLVLLPHEGERVERVVAYCEQVLDAMGIRHGPAHLDVRLTPSGPCLIEVGARMGGGWTDHYARMGTGESQLNWTVDAYTDPDRFLARHQERYRIGEFVAGAPLISPVEGTLRAYRGLEDLKRLESYHGLRTFVRPGDRIRRTVDDLTYPLLVELRHEVQDVVLRDLASVRRLDGERFYDVEQP
ncbi:ATP-grasp domain-containing protein [Streptomyces sp. GC420]|uniref:ATP-grasp domain-containing protein n=1 Tax=Streptomyces sp. GC420 TaxID=2697568 RepID=UPI001414F596|nr:ATP-grasp domain-containing protein [Streptomyces sp. GC420]NBM21025.1 ATP-grasp domain-containing protein [Streptomyces sp. GC420]